MRKRRKKIVQTTLGLLFSACLAGGVATACAKDEAVTPDAPVYAVDNVEALSVTVTPEYFDTYGVGETIAINNYETTVDGEDTALYAVLQKDYKVFALLTPEMEQVTHEFTETGTYNVVYYTQAESGQKTIVKNIRFTVGEQPYIDVVFDAKYMVNDIVSVQANCVFGEKKVVPTIFVKSPFGNTVTLTDGAAKLTECGKYTVSYTAQVDGVSVARTYYLTVSGSSDSYADYLINVSGVTKVESDVQAPDWAVDGTGVRVTGESFASFRYANIVDVDTVTKADNMVNFLPLGTDGYSTLSKAMIKFIDVYDETNVIAYECTYVKLSDRHTYCKIHYKDIKRAYRGNGEFFDEATNIYSISAGGVYFDVELHGLVEGEYGNLKWLRTQMDYAERKFYLTGGKTGAPDQQNEILDLDDPTHVGYGNEWTGFTTGEVYVQIELTGKGSQTGCIVQEIAGEKLYGEKTSTKGPDMLFDVEENDKLPTGVVGEYYPFPAVQYSIDAMDGKLLYPEYDIISLEKSLFDGLKYRPIALSSEEGFIPEEAGTYRITYQVKDSDGNVGTRQISFDVKDTLGEKGVAYDHEMPESFTVGKYFTVPKLIPTGLSYLVRKEESIIYNGADYADNAGEKVFLNAAGTITVKCSYKDYFGETYEYERSYSVVASNEAITELKGVVPEYVLKGTTIVLPNLSAINYSKAPTSAEYYPTWTLTVDGQAIDTNERAVTISKAHGETMQVVYSVGNTTIHTATMRVVETNYLADRFYVTSGMLTKENGANGVELTATTDATVDFINPLIVDANTTKLALTLDVAEDKANFEYIDVYFEDYLYSDIRVFVRITKTADGLFGQVNGKGEPLALAASTKYTGYTASYNVEFNAFEFSSRLVIKEDLNGNTFNGFPSNRINVSFEFRGVSDEAQLRVTELGLLGLLSNFDNQGALVRYEDKTIPSVISEGSYRDNSFEFGTTVYLPAVEARTMFSGLTTAKITVTAPSGKVILSNQNAYNDYSFVIDEYGTYNITYAVPFRSTMYRMNYTARVFKNELPEASLKTELAETYKLGSKLTIPEIVLTGAGAKLTTQCYLMKPDLTLTSVKAGDEVTLDTLGEHTLQVVVKDEYNVTFKSWKFKVEG